MKLGYAKTIRHRLLYEMKVGEFSKVERLPKEIDLAKQLGVSRTFLRDVLAQLEQEGFITRLHGYGTVINHHVLQVKYRMDLEKEFLDIICQNGYLPGTATVYVREGNADRYIAEKLQVSEGTEILCVYRVCTANEKPAIYCEDILVKELVKKEFSQEDFEMPIFHFIEKFCFTECYMDLTQIQAVVADEKVAAALEVSIGTPVMKMEEVDYDIKGNVVFYSKQYFVNEYFEHTVLRMKY